MRKIVYILIGFISILFVSKVNAYKEYKIGDEIEYNGIKFYVIKDSNREDDSIVLLKEDPLSEEEIVNYSSKISIETNKESVNFHSSSNDYATSFVKQIVDDWADEKMSTAIKGVRLITIDDLTSNLGYTNDYRQCTVSCWYEKASDVPKFVYNNEYYYWTMSVYNDSSSALWIVNNHGGLERAGYYEKKAIRPVVDLYKNVLDTEDENVVDAGYDKEEVSNEKDNTNNSTTVKVDNTYISKSTIIIIIGFIIASISLLIIYKLSNKRK